MLKGKDYMCKTNMWDVYFKIHVGEFNCTGIICTGREYLRIPVCLCFGFGQGPRIFTKLLKVLISLLHQLNIRIMISLGNILIMFGAMERLLVTRNTVILLVQRFRFVIKLKQLVMEPAQTIKYLGIVTDWI